MRHNNFRFTIKFAIPDNTPKELAEEYFRNCGGKMPQPCTKLKDISIITLTPSTPNTYIAYVILQTNDYGIPQVGVDLIASWIEQLYVHCEDFVIDAVIIHPKADPPANGAIIKWDYINDCPIVKIIT